ncbi:replication protein P [Zymobacter sp. IVIA_5232.4 C2]|uniref:replication protein P n=1 Tax=Zymobacter sp. IVIA_5232.4 C2 TaxID=3394855 RepID=UPI0039C2BB73
MAGQEWSTKGNSSNQSDRVPLIGESDIDDLFMHMTAIYGAKFSSAWGEFDENGVWLAELAGFTRQGLARGIKRCRQAVRESARTGEKAWPPQPLEFAGLCEPLPEDFGMPAADDAWHEAVQHSHAPDRHRWSHEAVRLAAQHTGWREIHETTAASKRERIEKRFARQYKALVNRVMSGEPLVAQHLIESDALRSPADLAERASHERAARQAERFSSLRTPTDALSAMRAMIGS